MLKAFAEMARVLCRGRFATVEFNNSDGQVFEAIKCAAREAGFAIENMVFLDKVQKSFKQIKGEKGEEDVVGHDVIFNLRKPGVPQTTRGRKKHRETDDPNLEHMVAQKRCETTSYATRSGSRLTRGPIVTTIAPPRSLIQCS